MKKGFLLLIVLLCHYWAFSQSGTVNAVIGDTSFLATFGCLPDVHTDEQLRVKTHLSYVEERLRSASTDSLSEEQRNNRMRVLDLLHAYHSAGKFPRNTAFSGERRPCFIDDFGTICAVGYLVEQTVGRNVARKINKAYQYAYLPEMTNQLEVISDWAQQHGLTLEECAMIQPSYSFMVVRKHKLGVTVGPTLTFGKVNQQFAGAEMKPLSGIELGLSFYHRIYGKWGVTTGLLYNQRKVEVSADGFGFRLQNDRLVVPLLLTWDKSYFYNKKSDKWRLLLGFQASVGVLNRPDGFSNRSQYVNMLEIDKRPELDACAGIAYTVEKPIYFRGLWTLRYNYGLLNRQSGTLLRGNETVMTYQLPGHYVSLTYTVSLYRGVITKMI